MFYIKLSDFKSLTLDEINIKIEKKTCFYFSVYTISDNNFVYKDSVKEKLNLVYDDGKNDYQILCDNGYSHILNHDFVTAENNIMNNTYVFYCANLGEDNFVLITEELLNNIIKNNQLLEISLSQNNNFILAEFIEYY